MDGSTVAHLSAMVNDPFYLDKLLKVGLDPSLRDKRTGQPLLSAAVIGSRDQQFRELLAAGANPNGADNQGNTPLHTAAKTDDFSKVLTLLRAGADPRALNAANSSFQNYLFMIEKRGLTEKAQTERAAVEEWLHSQGIEVTQHD